MSRGALVVALLLSLGVNLGLIGIGVARRRAIERYWGEGRPVDLPADRLSERIRQHDVPGGGFRPEGFPEEVLGDRLADRLGLEAERRERLVSAVRRMGVGVGDSRREIRRIREAIRREIGAGAPDRARVDALLDELAGAEVRLNRAFVDGVLDARSGLDEDESRQLLLLMAEFGLGRTLGEPRGPGPGPGGPPFGRRLAGDRRPLPPETAPPATP